MLFVEGGMQHFTGCLVLSCVSNKKTGDVVRILTGGDGRCVVVKV